jgi:hypothetical protein
MNIPKQICKMKYNKMNQKLGIGVLITILAVSMLLVNSEAQAQITTAGTQARQVTGQGDSTIGRRTTFTCPNGQPPPASLGQHVNDALQFSATQQNNQVTGTWDISSIFEPIPGFFTNTVKQGTITGGQITLGHFTLTGTETIDNTCGGPVPTQILISGQCGTATRHTTVQFTADNGEKGTFTASVVCT